MHPTRLRLLVGIAAIAAAIGWGTVQVVDAWTGRLLPVPWLSAAAMWLVAGAVAYWALASRPRLQRRPGSRPMPPIVAARSAALAMAASRIGALVLGFYAGVAVAMASRLATETGVQAFWSSVAAAAGSGALVAAGLWLEHLCRLPVGPPDGPAV
jgi:hypothetical protein